MSRPIDYTKPLIGKNGRRYPSPSERFWKKVDKTDDCWLWTASIQSNGYGSFGVNGENTVAHRVAYEMVKGPIPEGLVIDHLCRNPACVNPEHLEAVTQKENLRRGTHYCSMRTHCSKGHPFNEENTHYNKKGHRTCKTCSRDRIQRFLTYRISQ